MYNCTIMKLTAAFTNNDLMSAKFTCDGEGIFPELTVDDISVDAKFLTLIVDDPDAHSGTWVHVLLANILIE